MAGSAVVAGGSVVLRGGCLLAVAVLLGCPADRDATPAASRPLRGASTEELGSQGQCLDAPPSWERVDALLERSCRGCHSSKRSGDAARGGAPAGVDFDTEPQVRRHADRIRIRAVLGGNMPPSGALQSCSRDLLRQYLESVAQLACEPDCEARGCGDDGCGGSCGQCEAGQACSPAGSCQATCTPDCNGALCGDDGCGGSCGSCAAGTTCNAERSCECAPRCEGRSCGSDGCGGSCGTCADGALCSSSGLCACQPSCGGKQCGDDGCGGSCGRCTSPSVCDDNQCLCTPKCDGKQCGSDGCGGQCGSCADGLMCNTAQGQCVSSCSGDCSGRSCGDDGCGVSCGECDAGLSCSDAGACACVPDCAGKQCGDDGCGGECGPCDAGLGCNAQNQCVCMPDCSGRTCGEDGCGGSCGACDDGAACSDAGQCECVPSCTAGGCGDDGCGGTCGCEQGQSCDAGSCSWPEVSYANDVFPLFGSCAGACHAGMTPRASLNLEDAATAYAALVGVASGQCASSPKTLVVAGDVAGSYLINKLTGIGMCDPSTQRQMPRGTGAVLLTEAQIDVIRAWIATGALND